MLFPSSHRGRLRAVFLVAAWLSSQLLAQGKDPPEARPYVQIPLPENLPALFQGRLQMSQENNFMRNVLDALRHEARENNLDPEWLKPGNINPMYRMAIQQWKRGGGSLDPKTMGGLKQKLQDAFASKNDKKGSLFMPNMPLNPGDYQRNAPASPPRQKNDPDEALAKFVTKMFSRAQNTDMGDILQQSPAFQEGLARLSNLKEPNRAPTAFDTFGWRWELPNIWDQAWTDRLWDGLQNISLSDWSGKTGDAPALPWNSSWSSPALELPGLPARPGMETVLWLVLLAGLVVCCWKYFPGKRGRAASQRPTLGPWPVDPAQVATRAQLIQAFEFLALGRLGLEVKFWNHRAIAAHLTAPESPLRFAADALGRLYEHARYTEGEPELAAQEQVIARQALAALAGQP